jgi:hypothetical protein
VSLFQWLFRKQLGQSHHSRCVLSTAVSLEDAIELCLLKDHSLARISLPPDRGDSHMGSVLHHVSVRDARGVQHSLDDTILVNLSSPARTRSSPCQTREMSLPLNQPKHGAPCRRRKLPEEPRRQGAGVPISAIGSSSSPDRRRNAYLSAGKVMVSRHDLGPPVERAARRKALELDVLPGFGDVAVAVPAAVAILAFL